MVVGCHGGAGASTVALAVAEAARESGRSVRLLDCASPERSGLTTAVDAELGVDGSGWRQGRRAGCPSTGSAMRWPRPPTCRPHQMSHRDRLRSPWWTPGGVPPDVLTGDSWLAQAAESAAVVLVARATIPALRQLEQALATCPGDPVVAVLGPTRWDRSVRATGRPC